MPIATKTASHAPQRSAIQEPGGRRRVPARLRGGPLKHYPKRPVREVDVELGDLERLNERHDLSAFDAGPTDTEGQAVWLRDRALSNDARGYTRVFVTTYAGTPRVAAFFGITLGSVVHQGLPRRLRPHGTPPAIPAWFIARLAVDAPLQGRGIGRDIMLAALSRIVRLQQDGGGALVIVDAAGEQAQRLYARHRFVPLPQADQAARTTRMVATMTDVIELLQAP